MTKPFDSTTRELLELAPAEWLAFLGSHVADPAQVSVIDSNLSTITAEADKVIRVEGSTPWIELIELQAGRDVRLDRRSHYYSTLLEHRHQVPVRASVVLLRPAADGPELTGKLELRSAGGDVYDTFLYHVVRVWEQPVESVLGCGLTVLPLAPVARVALTDVREVLLAISKRSAETTPEQAASLWNATKILMGLRYDETRIEAIIAGVSAMLYGIRGIEESSVYQGILRRGMAQGKAEGKAEGMAEGMAEGKAKGKAEEARELLLRLGQWKLGPASREIEAQIAALNDIDQLHSLFGRILDVSSWDELLPAGRPAAPG